MTTDARILASEALNFGVGEVAAKSGIKLAWEIIVKFREELDIEEQNSR